MLKTILSISGKSGLYRLLSQGKGTLIVEALIDNKRLPIHAKDRVVSLGDISMYTDEDDMPLSEVLTKVYEANDGKAVASEIIADATRLKEAFAKAVPNYDKDRVYISDIKKLFTWYNILVGAGFTSFVEATTAED